ncbi:hypothetical protein [Nocardia farcinica]|uniref:hypothetical protein n=1 Tax=Nocardia farcinica TaxID=37329 RepID=UPI0015F01AF0|nr:hypothetical protein [Nocardia farcinica]MBA4855256.1 hypothetical protein [Nocardia farcinica]MBC9817749.1 hypothetical protein [Nocardia farcinica]
MYYEQVTVAGGLTAVDAEELAQVAGRYRARVTFTAHGRSVHAPVLPYCWDVLRVAAGDTVAVTVEAGPSAGEERAALREVAARLGTFAPAQEPKTRSTTALARRVMRR